MKIVFFGTPTFSVPSLQKLLADDRFQVVAVVTQPDKRRGRGNDLIPSPVKAVAVEQGIPVWQPKSVKKDPETLDNLVAAQADAFVVIAYGQILSQQILDMPRLGCINAHGSILPQYRGAAPIQWCLYQGEVETGITTMLMDAGMDTGPMLLKRTVPIALLDNAHQLAQTLADLSAALLVETLLQLEAGQVQPEPQDAAQATYAPLIRKEDYGLDWSRSAIALHNQVRGFFPDCVTVCRDVPLKVIATAPLGPGFWSQLPPALAALESDWSALSSTIFRPGAIVAVVKNLGPIVQTGEGLLLLREVQPSGKRIQSGWDFANGARLQAGERLQ
ncbi:methionyl-tRNA formyltransferase [Leptolyngbya sp. 'hensonii']|nr:methionyl-tRNA formyltransferase [Leptolyngbya sp. 'hensonii']OLP19911.1 methionyl-tRNA formyltransferase [Leptolyngbya sp. 'hensonii']